MLQDEEEAARGLPALEEERVELTQMVEEYEKLDAEDFVGGMPTRFRYREVCISPLQAYIQLICCRCEAGLAHMRLLSPTSSVHQGSKLHIL